MDCSVWLSNPKEQPTEITGRMSKTKRFPQQEKKCSLFCYIMLVLKKPFLKYRSVFKQQSLFQNKKSKYFVLMLLKQNVSAPPNHFF